MISTGKRSIKLLGVSEVLIDTTLFIGNPCIMEGFGRIFVIDGVYSLSWPAVSVIRCSKGRIFREAKSIGVGELYLDLVIIFMAFFAFGKLY